MDEKKYNVEFSGKNALSQKVGVIFQGCDPKLDIFGTQQLL